MRTLRYKPSKCTNHSQSDHNILIVLITTRQSFKRQGTLLYDLVRKKCTMTFCSEGELLTLRDWLKTAESSLTLPRRSLHENYELREYRRDIYVDKFIWENFQFWPKPTCPHSSTHFNVWSLCSYLWSHLLWGWFLQLFANVLKASILSNEIAIPK